MMIRRQSVPIHDRVDTSFNRRSTQNESIQRLAIENSDVFRSMHELLDLSLLMRTGHPSLEVSSLDDRLCAFFAKGTDVRGHREIHSSHWEIRPL